MKRIIDYMFVHTNEVSALIKQGWQPWYSPVATSPYWQGQALVKYDMERENTDWGPD